LNRDESVAGSSYVLSSSEDVQWLEDIEGIFSPDLVQVPAFLAKCLQAGGPAKGYIRYNASNAEHIPSVITLAGVLDAIPLEDGDPGAEGASLVFDAVTVFAGFDAADVTEYVYENYVNQTTTMAKMDPGWEQPGMNPFNVHLTGSINVGLADYIVKERLFAFYMYFGCIPLTREHRVFDRMTKHNPWPKPIAAYGYDRSFNVFGGDFFEAETTCAKERNVGQIATEGTSNLAFFSRKPHISEPLVQNPDPPSQEYDRKKTYVTFIVGDGDNINYMKGSRKSWMKDRLARCSADPNACFPLVWTHSPHLLHLAPDMARWYYNVSYQTGRDYFALPPSGDLYSYPMQMSDEVQEQFVENTERDCELMNTSGSVPWEFMGSWHNAIKHYFPRYAVNGIVRGLFPVNVPYMIPIFAFAPWERYKVFGGNTVLFKPHEWRGAGDSKIPLVNEKLGMATAKQMAREINGWRKGTAAAIYMTSDGGLNLDLMYEMVQYLDAHIEIVNQNTVVDMALAGHRLGLESEDIVV